jgi:hypothetical protein
MKTLTMKRKVIANALIWGSMMIAAALLMRDSGNSNSMFLILLMTAGWLTSNRLVSDS